MSHIANGKKDVRISVKGGSGTIDTMSAEPFPIEKLNWLIHLQHVRGEIMACKELIKNDILSNFGCNEYAHFKQGVMLKEEGKVQEALESFQICHKLNPENIENIKEIGKCLFMLRRNRLSLEAYMEAENASDKQDWEIYHNIGECLMRLGQTSKAKKYALRSVQLAKQESSYGLLVKILITQDDLRSAIAVCNACIEYCPDSTNMLTELGLLYLKVNQPQPAFERLSSALALDPICYKALLGIGCITQAHEEFEVALTKYKIAIQIEPESVALWNNIGMCFFSKQKYIAAIACLKRALWISPLNWKVLLNLGLVHLSTHQPASAFNFLCAAVNIRPDVGQSFMMLGCALLDLNDSENGSKAFRQAVLLSPDDPVALVNTSVCLFENQFYEECYQHLNRFNDLLAHNPNVRSELVKVAEKLISSLPTKTLKSNQIQSEETSVNAVTDNVLEEYNAGTNVLQQNNENAPLLDPDEV